MSAVNEEFNAIMSLDTLKRFAGDLDLDDPAELLRMVNSISGLCASLRSYAKKQLD